MIFQKVSSAVINIVYNNRANSLIHANKAAYRSYKLADIYLDTKFSHLVFTHSIESLVIKYREIYVFAIFVLLIFFKTRIKFPDNTHTIPDLLKRRSKNIYAPR